MKKILLFFFLLTTSVFYSATIKGRVTDVLTGEELVGATVAIKELKMAVSVGLDGSFVLKNVPPGTYTLTTSYISYEYTSTLVLVKSNEEEVSVTIKLKSVGIIIDAIEILGTRDLSSESSARTTERDAVNVMNVVSAKAIELSPDLNIANVIQRMSGITLDKSSGNGSTYALLRGMDKRYNYTLVNGIKIPSTNNKHRYVPLDIFPSDLVDRIEVTKAVTADMEGDAIAGAVNLVMKNAPDKFLVMANTSFGFSQIFFEQSMKSFDTKAVNPESPYELQGKNYNAVPGDFSKGNLDLKQTALPLNNFSGLTLGNRFFNKKFGILISGSYQNVNRATSSLLFRDDLSRDGQNLPLITNMHQRMFYEHQTNYGVHAKLDYRFNKRHQLKLYVADMNFKIAQVRSDDQTDLEVSYFPEQGTANKSHSDRTRLTIQNLFTSTLQGDHELVKGLFVNWSAVYSKASNHSPDEVTISYETPVQNGSPLPQYGALLYGNSYRIWRYNTDEDKAGYLNLKYATKAGSVKTEFSAGAMYRMKDRTSFYNKYTLDSKGYKGLNWNEYSEIQWTVSTPNGIRTSENYEAVENTLAYYGMAKVNVKRFQAIAGLRMENFQQGYDMWYPQGERRPSETYTYTNVLPSVHLKYEVNPKNNLRMSYYKATNRPGFYEIVPFIVVGDDYSQAGNPDLKPAVADNVDLRWEYYPSKLDQVMAGFFYKNIQDPIEYAFVDYLGNSHVQVYSPINSDKATNYGFELDFTKFFNQIGIKANYTLTRSSITTNKLSRVKTAKGQDSTIYVSQSRPLFGQSAHVANLSLLYQSQHNGLSAQLALSYTGERIYSVSRYIDNDLWQKGFFQLDFSAEKRFKKGLSVFVKAQNLLNTHLTVYIKKTNPLNDNLPSHSASDKNTLVRSEYSMQTYLAGVRYKF
ncbi:TonB-dependent receptor [Sphingobacteriaceae bacterium]|nr:TonB-dependent receptor [Sphingobacteriaceae bacterium]